ncbi:MAG: class I SAM-dependent methyltransferase [Candidatus Kariarchaeaceae archaeon]
MPSEEYRKYSLINKANWNNRVTIHAKGEFYDIIGFKKDPERLSFVSHEHEEIGDVKGKTLLHLQCHFGLDTISWARLGAIATGMDFSSTAIKLAKSISEDLEMNVQFVESDLYELPKNLQGEREFDIVFTSCGSICWLPDLERWAEIIAHFLKPGGLFYIKDTHPFSFVFDDETKEGFKVKYPYFHGSDPLSFDEESTYGDESKKLDHTTTFAWDHTLSEIVNSLIKAGLVIESLNEFPYGFHKYLTFMKKGSDGEWLLPKELHGTIPLTFAIKARKPLE